VTVDSLLNILLAVVIPGFMALAGGILAAKALPTVAGKRNVEKWYWSSVFILLFVVGVVLAFVQQVRDTSRRENEQQNVRVEELRTHGDLKYLQGQLDTQNSLLAKLASSGDPTTGKAIVAALASVVGARTEAEKSTNKQLCEKAHALAAKIWEFQTSYQEEERNVYLHAHDDPKNRALDPDAANALRMRVTQQENEMRKKHEEDFRAQFFVDAKYLRDSMFERLSESQRVSLRTNNAQFDMNLNVGTLNGAANEYGIANYLEEITKVVCPSGTPATRP
jgi:hypothetical protein